VGIAEKQTTDAEQAQYCQMVKEGLWPDYNKSYAKECPGGATHRNGTLTKK
jgi:hypothetical protein